MNMLRQNHVNIDRILVVVDPDEEFPGQPGQTSLIDRAVTVAQAAGAELELFFPCHDPSLELKLFANREEISREKEQTANRLATGLAELALDLKTEGLDISHEVRWDYPPSDAILRKIADSGPDLVMKHTRSPNYVLGLSQNTDWELIRNAPAHIWFVKERDQADGPVVTAIGNNAEDEDIIGESDENVFRVGNFFAECLEANNIPVHCFQVPNVHAYATYAPDISGVMAAATQSDPWQDLAKLHGDAIARFAERFDIDPSGITLLKGEPARELPEQAQKFGAGLLVMGARNLGRWERALNPVAAEPVLAEAPCDLLFVKKPGEMAAPRADATPVTATPDVNLEMAVIYPDKAFKTPQVLARSDQLSRELRLRLLEIWEMDARAQMRAEEEGGPISASQAGVLKEIQAAYRELANTQDRKAS